MKRIIYILILCAAFIYSCKAPIQKGDIKQPVSSSEKDKTGEFNITYLNAEREKISGNNEEAIKLYEKCLLYNPNSSGVYYNLAKLNKNNVEVAMIFINKALVLEEINWYLEFKAELLSKNNNQKEANEQFEKLIIKSPKTKDYYTKAIQGYLQTNEIEKCLTIYDKYEKYFGVKEDITYQKFQSLLRLNKAEMALVELDKLILKYPKKLNYQLTKSTVLNKLGKTLESEENYLKIIQNNHTQAIQAWIGLAYYYKDKNITAKFSNAVLHIFNDSIGYENEKLNFLTHLNQQLEADTISLLTSKIEQFGTKNFGNYKIVSETGTYFHIKNNPVLAIKFLAQAVTLTNSEFKIVHKLLQNYSKIHDWKLLNKSAEIALETFPYISEINYLNALANFKIENYDNAISYANTALLNINDSLKAYIYSIISISNFKKGNFTLAQQNILKIDALDNNVPSKYIAKGLALLAMNQIEEAQKVTESSNFTSTIEDKNKALCTIYLNQKKYTETIKIAENLNPSEMDVLLLLYKTYTGLKNTTMATNYKNLARKLNPNIIIE